MRCDQARSALYNLTLPISKVTRLPTQVGEQETQPITWPSSANNASLLQGHIKLALELKQSLYLNLYFLFLPNLHNTSQVRRHVWPIMWHDKTPFQELWYYHIKEYEQMHHYQSSQSKWWPWNWEQLRLKREKTDSNDTGQAPWLYFGKCRDFAVDDDFLQHDL